MVECLLHRSDTLGSNPSAARMSHKVRDTEELPNCKGGSIKPPPSEFWFCFTSFTYCTILNCKMGDMETVPASSYLSWILNK